MGARFRSKLRHGNRFRRHSQPPPAGAGLFAFQVLVVEYTTLKGGFGSGLGFALSVGGAFQSPAQPSPAGAGLFAFQVLVIEYTTLKGGFGSGLGFAPSVGGGVSKHSTACACRLRAFLRPTPYESLGFRRAEPQKSPFAVAKRLWSALRLGADSNRRTRFCRPLPSHSATQPF